MRIMGWSFGLVLAVVLVGSTSVQGAPKARFVQDRFCISLWFDPPADANMDASYADLAEANFNVIVGSHGARSSKAIARQLKLCEKYGLKAIVHARGIPDEAVADGPACWGYLLTDEPKVDEYAGLRARVDKLRKLRPGKLGYINLFPSHCTPKHWGVETYEEYVSQYMDEVQPDVLCFDRYPIMRPGRDERDGYLENLAVIREHALKADIPFWNFFKSMPYSTHFDPTESQIRWQVFSSLAYGAKGVLYFCYWTPPGKEFPKGGAVINRDGRRTWHFEHAKRTNAILKALGPTIMKLTSTAVYQITPDDDASKVLADSPIRELSEGDYLVGVFRHKDGRRAVMLNNNHFAYTAWPTVAFDAPVDRITEIDQATGKEIPIRDDSPRMEGLQLHLPDGSGRLFLLPPEPIEEVPGLKLLSVRKIWDKGPHNAFTDLIRYKGAFYCIFREGTEHGVKGGGTIRVLRSMDGEKWASVAHLSHGGFDLRDPKVVITPDGRLSLYAAGALPEPPPGMFRRDFVWFSEDGQNWSEPAEVGEPGTWLWRVTWHDGYAWGLGYAKVGDQRFARLYRSKDGIDFEIFVPNMGPDGYPSESSKIDFAEDGTAQVLLRRQPRAMLGTAKPPYADWQWRDIGIRVGGPQMIRLPDGRLFAAGRSYDRRARTSLFEVDFEAGKLAEVLALPSGGDTSYPGMLWHDGLLWMSYYASHEGKTSIYLAKIALPGKP